MLLKWQEDWLGEHFSSYSWVEEEHILNIPRPPAPLEEAVLMSWTGIDLIYVESEDFPDYIRCSCGEVMLKGCGPEGHDCWCIECQQVKVPGMTWTPELSASDHIRRCPSCGQLGAHYSIVKV
jgi:hypothetical protein